MGHSMNWSCSLAILLSFDLVLPAGAGAGLDKGAPNLGRHGEAGPLRGTGEAEDVDEVEPRAVQGGEFAGEEGGHVAEGEEGEGHLIGAHEEGKEGAEEFSAADIQVACMLLGGVSFVMLLMYLVNWNDDDIRRYSWKIISTTISIFLAVLLFQGFNQVLLTWASGLGELAICGVQSLHCLIYIAVLQFTIAYIAGAICDETGVDLDSEEWVINDPLSKDNGTTICEQKVRNKVVKRSAYEDEHGMEVPVQKVKKELIQRMRRMKCYARLLAHMAGFAAINLGSTMQHLSIFRHQPAMALIPVVIVQLAINMVFAIKGKINNLYMADREVGTGQTAVRCTKMANEEVLEAENDISALSSSFLIVQVIRFAICGVLANEEGIEDRSVHASGLTIACLYSVSLFFAVASIALVQYANWISRNQGEDSENEQPRVLAVSMNSTSMAFAWCVLWGTRWLFIWLCSDAAVLHAQSMIGRVVMALLLSGTSCLTVFALDFVSDGMDESGTGSQAASQAIQVLVNALGILIGFSWEHGFDGGVAAVAAKTGDPVTVKFLMGLLITSMVLPMWRRHILTKEMALEQMKELRDKYKKRLRDQPSWVGMLSDH